MRATTSISFFFWLATVGSLVAGQDEEGFYFWRWGHMDGPHDSSKALGISRDGKTVVGATTVVDFERAWRSDIDWAINTDDGLPPLYNELQVQEDVGVIHPSEPSAAYAASNMNNDTCIYDKRTLDLDWCGSTVVGTCKVGKNSYGVQWLFPVLDALDPATDYIEIPDIGGGISDMRIMDVSSDGTIIVGTGYNKKGPIAFWANVTDPLVVIVKTLTVQDSLTLKSLQTTKAEAVSADGLTIVGYGSLPTGNRAFISTVLDGATVPITLESSILPLFGGGRYAEAYALAEMEEGNFIVAGRCDSPKGPQACIWFKDPATMAWVVKPLGALAQKIVDSTATGIAYRPNSTVGELMVIGYSRTNLYASEAFVWTGNPVLVDDLVGYFYDLEYILTKTGVAEFSGMGSDWVLTQATGISVLGDRIVGWGVNPEGGIEAFVVTGYPYDELVFTHE